MPKSSKTKSKSNKKLSTKNKSRMKKGSIGLITILILVGILVGLYFILDTYNVWPLNKKKSKLDTSQHIKKPNFKTTLKNFISEDVQINDILFYNKYTNNLLNIYHICGNDPNNPICTKTPEGIDKVQDIMEKYQVNNNDSDFSTYDSSKLANYIIAYNLYINNFIASKNQLNNLSPGPKNSDMIKQLQDSINDSKDILNILVQYIPPSIIKFFSNY